MIRPPLEVADLIHTAGTAFIERHRQWIRWPHIKVLLAIARCRTAALGPISISAPAVDIAPPSTTAAETGIARSVRPGPANTGSKHGAANFSPRPTPMSSSLCLSSWPPGFAEQKDHL